MSPVATLSRLDWGVDTARLMCTGYGTALPRGDQTQRENWYLLWTGVDWPVFLGVCAPRDSVEQQSSPQSGRYICCAGRVFNWYVQEQRLISTEVTGSSSSGVS